MIMIWVMDKRDIVDGALRAAAFAIKNKPPTVTDTIPTVDDLITQLQAESPEEFPQPGLGEIPQPVPQEIKEKIATACVGCAVGHFSACTGALNEAMRFKEGGMSDEVVDRLNLCLDELNILERKDLTRTQIASLPEWEKTLAEKALKQSRDTRHKIEAVASIEDVDKITVETEKFRRELGREWFKGKLREHGKS